MAVKSDPPAATDYVSPVLTYLGATPGQVFIFVYRIMFRIMLKYSLINYVT